MRGLLLRSVASLVLLLATASAARAATLSASAMNGWSLRPLSPAMLDQQLAAMEAAGVTLVRDDASWQEIEPVAPGPGGHSYRFATEDYRVGELARHHLAWLPILDYSAPWAAANPGDWRSPPADDSQFAAYSQAIAARYGENGSFWRANPQLPYMPVHTFEIWNEENGSYFWDTGPDPARYAQLYLAARAAIRSVQPGAQVIVGGLINSGAWAAQRFLAAMFRAVPSLAGELDGVGFHPYQRDWVDVDFAVIALRSTLDGLGEWSVPIDVTEFGWQTGTAAQEAWRATQMGQVAITLARSNCGVAVVAPYDWYNQPGSAGGDFGLSDGTRLRPAGGAWFYGLAVASTLPTMTMCAAPPVGPPPPPRQTPPRKLVTLAITTTPPVDPRATVSARRHSRRTRHHSRRRLRARRSSPRYA